METLEAYNAGVAADEHVEIETRLVGASSFAFSDSLDCSYGHGDSLGRYVIVEKLGSGGMGVVYSAYDPELERKVAINASRPNPGSLTVGSPVRTTASPRGPIAYHHRILEAQVLRLAPLLTMATLLGLAGGQQSEDGDFGSPSDNGMDAGQDDSGVGTEMGGGGKAAQAFTSHVLLVSIGPPQTRRFR